MKCRKDFFQHADGCFHFGIVHVRTGAADGFADGVVKERPERLGARREKNPLGAVIVAISVIRPWKKR